MIRPKPLRRSMSPFGLRDPEDSPFDQLTSIFRDTFGPVLPDEKPALKSFADAKHVPFFIRKIASAAANDAPDLGVLCSFLVQHRVEWDVKNVTEAVFSATEELFKTKTDVFLIEHQNRATLEKLGLPGDSRDMVLFSKERNLLVGGVFSPFTETNPGLFSEFITRWVETENLDRLLHFLDFASGGKDPTFEHYLVFAHSALQRIVTNKAYLRTLFLKINPLLKKLTSPTWESHLRTSLEL